MGETAPSRGSAALFDADRELVERLRARDERAFMELVERYHGALLRVARRYVSSREAAEEVVQETWLAVLNGIDRFEGRSSLKTWLFRILTNQALTRRSRERNREVSFSDLVAEETATDEPAVDDSRFHRMLFLRGAWREKPKPWEQSPEELALSAELLAVIEASIARLPAAQATVITLRDIQGFSADETCEALSISEGNQRVLLHRARSKVRQALETHLQERI